MVSSNELKNGMVIEYDGKLVQIIEFMHVLQNKVAYVRVKMKDLRTGTVTETALKGSETSFKKCFIEKKEMQYIYNTGDALAFMDMETYEQIELNHALVEYEMKFLVENMTVEIEKMGDEILGIILPDKVTLLVTKCDPAVKGDTKTNALKDAYVETGLLVKVPMFIEEGEKIIISTETGKYSSRA